MTITPELFNAAERTLFASGSKPKDAAAIIAKLESDFQIKCGVAGGLLTMTQGESNTPVSVGTVLAAYKAKNARDFYGEAGEINFKDDLQGDPAAKIRYINEHGGDAWARLPLNEASAKANGQTATNAVIPSIAMRASEYKRLTSAEKSKLITEIGRKGVEAIMARR
jgi:L,D-peptidoglycan transpeptidase YkuD (ErfK/YbiS/YcfS/YnhG family)